MKRYFGGLLGAFFDTRVLIVACGIILSIIMHELFHVIMHWGEITSIHLLPNSSAIVEIVFTPVHNYDLLIEELCAYGVTALTIMLTIALVHDINDSRDNRSVEQIIMARHYTDHHANTDRADQLRLLRLTLGTGTPTNIHPFKKSPRTRRLSN